MWTSFKDGNLQRALGALLVPALLLALEARAATTNVAPGLNTLRDAIIAAAPGDTLILQANQIYGGFGSSAITLPVKTGTGWITIQSDALASLPAGQRVKPNHAAYMPKIVSAGNNYSAIKTAAGAHHYKFLGCEFYTGDSKDTTSLVALGTSNATQDTLAEIPYAFILDRCYLHALNDTQSITRAIAMDCGRGIASGDTTYSEITNCHISGVKTLGSNDSQTISGSNGGGPYRIINNYLEAVGENIMFGGTTAYIPGVFPSDIEIRGNHFFKPLSWRGIWPVKNLFELKSGRRITIEGNVFENCWSAGQTGDAILFKLAMYDAVNSNWIRTEDITFRNNIVRHAGGACTIQGRDYAHNSPQGLVRRINVVNNLWEDIDNSIYGGSGKFVFLSHGPVDITFDHNTAFNREVAVYADNNAASGGPFWPTNFVFRNNIANHYLYGIWGAGAPNDPVSNRSWGDSTFSMYFNDGAEPARSLRITRNILMGGPNGATYNLRPGHYFPASWSSVFVNHAAGDYHVRAGSTFKAGEINDATDGKDLGVDLIALTAATAGVVQNTPNILPTVTIGYPTNNQTICVTNANVTIMANASDSAGAVTKVQFYGGSSGTTLLGEDTTSPYTWNWAGLVAGTTYRLKARVTDNSGAWVDSALVTVTATSSSSNILPTCSFAAPLNNATYAAGDDIYISARGTDTDGRITRIEVFRGSTPLDETYTPWFSPAWGKTGQHNFYWYNAPAGTYSLTVKATDNSGAVTTSSAISITVTGSANSNPAITSEAYATPNPANVSDIVVFSAAASDADGDPLSFSWNFGDGSTGSGATPSHSYSSAGTYNAVVTVTDGRGGSVTDSVSIVVTAPTSPLPWPWAAANVGTSTGTSTYSGGAFTIVGQSPGGVSMADNTDGFRFVYMPITGDGTITIRFAAGTNSDRTKGCFGGVMFRENLTAGSICVSNFVLKDGGLGQDVSQMRFRQRTAVNGVNANVPGSPTTVVTHPRWLRLTRAGNAFTASHSADGVNFTVMAPAGHVVSMSSSALVGIIVGHNDTVSGCSLSATIDNATVWQHAQIGGTSGSSSVIDANGRFNLSFQSPGGVGSTSDGLRYVYTHMPGDGSLTIRVPGITNTNTASGCYAGVMVRESTAAGSRNVSAFAMQDGGFGVGQAELRFRSRVTTGGSTTTHVSVADVDLPRWLKLTRSGNTFTAYYSSDGLNFTQYGSTSPSPIMASNMLIGVFVGHNSTTAGSTASCSSANSNAIESIKVTP